MCGIEYRIKLVWENELRTKNQSFFFETINWLISYASFSTTVLEPVNLPKKLINFCLWDLEIICLVFFNLFVNFTLFKSGKNKLIYRSLFFVTIFSESLTSTTSQGTPNFIVLIDISRWFEARPTDLVFRLATAKIKA